MAERIPLALLPGLCNDRTLWRHQIEELDDLAECWVADFTTQSSVGDMARSVLEWMPGRFAVAGLSMGGYVAFEIMRQAPERVGLLGLLDTKARLDTAEQTSRRRGLIELAEKGDFKGVTPRLLQMFVHESRHKEPLAKEVTAMAERVGREAFLKQQQAIMSRPDSLPTLAGIACPTLVICGRQDQPTPVECHEEIAAGIPDAELVVIEDCGHLSPMERPQQVTDALRTWLARWPS